MNDDFDAVEFFKPLIDAGVPAEQFLQSYRYALSDAVSERIITATDVDVLRDALTQVLSLARVGSSSEEIDRAVLLTLKPPADVTPSSETERLEMIEEIRRKFKTSGEDIDRELKELGIIE